MVSAAAAGRRFGDRVAVADLTFDVRAGEIFGLVGPNGAGKTTTLRMLAGLIPPTSGEIRVDGTRLDRSTSDRLRRSIGFLTETPGLWEQLTVLDNLRTYARLFDVAGADAASERELRAFGLWERRGDRAGLLSKGMKQKLALARALVHSPRVLLLDEPTANLDPQTARDVRGLLLDLRASGCAIVVSTHNLDEIERIADRIALISMRLVALDTPAALRRDVLGRRLRIRFTPPCLAEAQSAKAGEARSAKVEARTIDEWAALAAAHGARDVRPVEDGLSMTLDDADTAAPAIVAALAAAGASIREVFDERAPLEEVYLRLLHKEDPS